MVYYVFRGNACDYFFKVGKVGLNSSRVDLKEKLDRFLNGSLFWVLYVLLLYVTVCLTNTSALCVFLIFIENVLYSRKILFVFPFYQAYSIVI